MKIAITGGTGFIGREVDRLAQMRGHDTVLIDKSHGGDIMNEELVNEAVQGCDAVIHLAGKLGTSELLDAVDSAIDVNIRGTVNVLRATQAADAVYVGVTMPNVWPSLYQATKIAAQRVAEAFHNAYGLPVTHIRAFNAYGPGQAHGAGHPQKIIPTFAYNAWRGVPIPIWGEGDQTVDLVHVDDIAIRMVLAAEDSAGDQVMCGDGSVWDAGSGIETSVLDVARFVMKTTGSGLIEFLPMRAGELPHTKLCASEFGQWTPDVVQKELYAMGATHAVHLIEVNRLANAIKAYRP